MIKSQAKFINNLTPNIQKKKALRQCSSDAKQNVYQRPPLSARLKGSNANDNIKKFRGELTDYDNKLNQTVQTSIKEFNLKLGQVDQSCQELMTERSLDFRKIKTQLSDNCDIQYGKVKKIQRQSKADPILLNKNNMKGTLSRLVRIHVQSNVQENHQTEHDEYMETTSTLFNNTTNLYEQQGRQISIQKRQYRASKIKQKRVGLSMQAKNIDNMNHQIHTLLGYLKQNRSSIHKQNDEYQPLGNYAKTKNQSPTKKYSNKSNKSQPKQVQLLHLQPIQQQYRYSYERKKKKQDQIFRPPQQKFNLTQHPQDINSLNKTYENICHRNKQTDKPANNTLQTDRNQLNLIDNKINSIKQRIQQSQGVTKAMEYKYLLQSSTEENDFIQKQRSRSFRKPKQNTLIQKIHQIKREMLQRQPLTQRFQINRRESSFNKESSQTKIRKNFKQETLKDELLNNTLPFTQKSYNMNQTMKKSKNVKPNQKIKDKNEQVQKSKPNRHNSINLTRIIKKIAKLLHQQVAIDRQMRHYRELFCSLPSMATTITALAFGQHAESYDLGKKQDKWKFLYSKISKAKPNLKYSLYEIRNIVEISTGESDPFRQFGPQPPGNLQIIVEKLVPLFMKSQNHWNSSLCGCINIQQLQESDFGAHMIDLNHIGYICVQDLVCFVNLHTNNLYRNRDLLTVFKRFCQISNISHKENKISYQDMQKVLLNDK